MTYHCLLEEYGWLHIMTYRLLCYLNLHGNKYGVSLVYYFIKYIVVPEISLDFHFNRIVIFLLELFCPFSVCHCIVWPSSIFDCLLTFGVIKLFFLLNLFDLTPNMTYHLIFNMCNTWSTRAKLNTLDEPVCSDHVNNSCCTSLLVALIVLYMLKCND
jgi:hypothetical protein